MISSISLMRRTVYEQVNGYDETFGIHREDTDLFLRIALWSKIHYVSEKLARRRCHSNQDTTDSAEFRRRGYLQTQKLYAKWKKGEGFTTEQKKMVSAAWRFKQGKVEPYEAFLRAYEYLRMGNVLKALRFYMGGIKYYLTSFIPWIKI
jgi:GT2 family glycosyltransferase